MDDRGIGERPDVWDWALDGGVSAGVEFCRERGMEDGGMTGAAFACAEGM